MGFFEFFTGHQPPLIKGALEDVCVMLDTGRDMFAAASAHLLDNEILDVDLKAMDATIDQREQALRRAVLEHLNVDPKSELVLCLKLLTVAQEAERIGDLAKMMGVTAGCAHHPRMGPMASELRDFRNRVHGLFDQTRDGFIEGDPTRARDLLRRLTALKSELSAWVLRLASAQVTSNEAVLYTLGAHAMSRVGSHLGNIVRSVGSPFDRIRSGELE